MTDSEGFFLRSSLSSMSASLIGCFGSSTFRLSAAAVSMSLTGSCFSSESAPRPLYGAFVVKEFARQRIFVLRHFFCSISKTVSSPDPHFALVDARSRLAVAPTLRRDPPLSGHTLTASRATARLRGRDNDQRGARYRARFNRATTLYPVGPRTRTMMQSCASAAKLRSGGPILPVGMKAKGLVGVPPPRTVIGAPSQACGQGRNYRDAFNVLRLLCRTHNDAVRDNTLSHEPPQGDQKLACQGHDHGLSSTASVLGAGSKPFRQGAVLLV